MAFKGPGMGLIVGAGLGGGIAAGVRAFTALDKWSTLIGMAGSFLIGAGVANFTKSKSMGWEIAWAGLLTGAPRAIEELVTGQTFSGLGLGEYRFGQGPSVQVLGLTTASEQTYGSANIGTSFGAVPVAGVQ